MYITPIKKKNIGLYQIIQIDFLLFKKKLSFLIIESLKEELNRDEDILKIY